MLKKYFTLFLYYICCIPVWGQEKQPVDPAYISRYFKEIKKATEQGFGVWNKDLYGNILLVDPATRQLYSNNPDLNNALKPNHDIYQGTLPDDINIANTSVRWGGKVWAMIMLPLPDDKYERVNLSVHELFHTAQASLGFAQNNKESKHLDQKEGRIFLRLELQALKKAILAATANEQKKHLSNALMFRKHRNLLFPGSDDIENQLELNEGIAEYTGFAISGRTKEQAKMHFISNVETFIENPTYVRSFAYVTTPIYGYFVSLKDKNWNREISAKTNLTDFFIGKLNIKIPDDLKSIPDKVIEEYDGLSIIAQEKSRDEKIQAKIAEYKARFIEKPHFEIIFEKMNISFDPRNILSLEDKGTVYPNVRVTDNWGILEVNKAALISPDWGRISIDIPEKINGSTIEGDGWILKLKGNYKVGKDEKDRNYILIKQ
ncbi:hypothetical protein [Chryseobacterium taichungense]|uniref:hypothetical protein n=1 Tax=Chryseobacterium taichungense TaxID=295069 RepID=UPI0028A6E769|nr:hypothetical protein [Chryseobacterium taichungense]